MVDRTIPRLLSRGTPEPQPFDAGVRFTKKFRFTSTSTYAAVNVSVNDLLDLLCVGVNATAATRLCSAIRIVKCELWTPSMTFSSSGTASQSPCQFIWDTTTSQIFGAPDQALIDATLGTNSPGHICTHPPSGSLMAHWIAATYTTSGTYVFSFLSTPPGSVFDLTIEMCLATGTVGGGQTAVQSALTGATAGATYVRGLPCSAPVFVPVGVATI